MVSSWNLVLFVACIVGGSGLAMALGAGEWRELSVPLLLRVAVAALIVFSVGGVAATVSLGRPALIFGALSNPKSGIFRELVSTAGTIAFLFLYAVSLWRGASVMTCRVLASFAGVAALASSAAVGSALYMPWHPGWHTLAIILPLPCWAISAAAAVLSALFKVENDEEGGEDEWLASDCELSRRLVLPSTLLPAAGLAVYVAVLIWGPAPSDAPTASRLLVGDLAVPFWAGSVVAGLVVPFALAAATRHRPIGIIQAVVIAVFAAAAAASYEWTVSQLGTSVWHFFVR